MKKSARALFDVIGEKIADQFPRMLLRGDQGTGFAPSQYGSVELHSANVLSIKTATAETKGIIAGVGAHGLLLGLLLALFGILGDMKGVIVFLGLGFGMGMLALCFLWELYRPFPLPIILNRRTQEIYYDLNGKLYHAPWEGIEAVGYEYRQVNQYTGDMPHASLDLILHRFGDPEDCIALNIGGHTSGKRIETLAALWEYLRAYMNVGPWFDENGNPAAHKTLFITEQLKHSEFRISDSLKTARKSFSKSKANKDGRSGALFLNLLSAYIFHPMWFAKDLTYRICRDRADRQWPKVVQERLESDGPTTRLVDIEADCDRTTQLQ